MSDEGTYRQELWFTTRFVRVPPPPILRQDYILVEARNPEILSLPPGSPGWRARPRGRERVAYVGKGASFASSHTLYPLLKSIPPPPSLVTRPFQQPIPRRVLQRFSTSRRKVIDRFSGHVLRASMGGLSFSHRFVQANFSYSDFPLNVGGTKQRN
jgi:hypothetical protein